MNEIQELKSILQQTSEYSGAAVSLASQLALQVVGLKKELEELRTMQAPRPLEIKIGDAPAVKIDGITHETLPDIVKLLRHGPVYMYGPAGTGKSVIAKQVAKVYNLPFQMCAKVGTKYDLTGFVDANGNLIPTPFYDAFVNGGIFFLDELDGCGSDVAVSLNGALANRWIDIPKVGMVYANPKFMCIAAGNTCGTGGDEMYVGRNPIDAATLDRFFKIEVDYDERIDLKCAMNDMNLVRFAHEMRKVIKSTGLQAVCSYRSIERIAALRADGYPLDRNLELSIFGGWSVDELTTIASNMYLSEELRDYDDAIMRLINKKS